MILASFLFSSEFPGRCFGRGFFDDLKVDEENTVSGTVADCSRGESHHCLLYIDCIPLNNLNSNY